MSDSKISDATTFAQLEALVKQHAELARRKERTAGELASVTDRLDEAMRRAEEEFGTSDLVELRGIIVQRRESNVRKVAELTRSLSEISDELKAIDEETSLSKGP